MRDEGGEVLKVYVIYSKSDVPLDEMSYNFGVFNLIQNNMNSIPVLKALLFFLCGNEPVGCSGLDRILCCYLIVFATAVIRPDSVAR